MMKKKLTKALPAMQIILSILLCLISSFIFAQGKISIRGKVTSDNNLPLAGATVSTKNGKNATITDSLGQFTLQANKGDTATVSFIGYAPYQFVASAKVVNVSLNTAGSKGLEDVLVIGYGSQSKRNLASSIVTVSATDFKDAVVITVDQALEGRAAGVQVVTSSGEPGAQAVVRIRGNNSLSGNNEPLYVIDGFPMPTYTEASTNFDGSYSLNGLYGINPNDIDNIEVLKDASATAIYGSRGANGVVLITTKAGRRGEGKIQLIDKTSIGGIAKPIKMMNGKQYAEIANEFYQLTSQPQPFGNVDTVSTNTDWFDAVTRRSSMEDIALNVSGGNPKSAYYISGDYLKEKGILLASDNLRGSLRFNLSNEVNNWYTIKSQLSFVRQTTNRAVTSQHGWPSSGGLLNDIRQAPTIPSDYLGYNSAGIPGYVNYWFGNPIIEANSRKDVLINDYSIINIENLFTLAKNLKFVVNVGANQSLSRRQVFLDANTEEGHNTNGIGSNSSSNTYSYNVNAYLAYNKQFNDISNLNITLGGEYNNQVVELLNTTSSDFAIPFFGVNNIGSAQTQQIGSYKETRLIQSAFLRANYSYKGKYILNASSRLDGASPFAENKKYGLFPAIGAAWNMGQEDFMKNVNFISNSKVRASYGITGSQAIPPYSSLAQYNYAFYEIGANNLITTVLYPSTLGNANLTWERTAQTDIGVDFNTWKNRITFSADYYHKLTSHLLQPRVLPSQSGYSTIIDNYGTIQNNGIEFGIQADIVKSSNFQYTTRLNFTKNKNILVNLGDQKGSTYVSTGGNLTDGVTGILTPGQEIGEFYGYKVTGLAQASDFKNGVPNYPFPGPVAAQWPGTLKYQDLNGDGIIDANDRQILGHSSPAFTFGWTNTFTWKRLSLNIFIIGSEGNDVLDLSRFYFNNGIINYFGVPFNQTADWYAHRWTPANPTNDTRYPGIQFNMAVNDITSSMIEDGSYVRLKTLTLAYSFPKVKVVKNLSLFITGTNLITLTHYKGFDPEVSSFNQSLLQQGIDYGAYPTQITCTFGLSCNF
jgi:TonB-linked SusC/RagA family outer membrane protein